jgi:hypothetical protein
MEDNWKKVQAKKIDTKLQNTLERKLNHLKSVIADPDKYNSNLASKDKVESLEQQIDESNHQIKELQEVIEKLNRRVDGLSYLIKQKINI